MISRHPAVGLVCIPATCEHGPGQARSAAIRRCILRYHSLNPFPEPLPRFAM